ncbi:aminotransferase class I/II-fold pyridoxal phosphate-dependent enzyme [Actinomadura sp. 7K534]|uniref:MalY/PatB family protein n=1 Tax=Actinomadura sp. 7K534 TaxID=2530366 RepID=UPI001049DABE|nr:aminotransferase class I/II-fold pyridoxal phosphate-dependent enzyme [Actinomadura sp. 7K534]TDB96424.1 aminotransferase class I/II-fold pyridoxal phosphate-dependent enzyme [Actinomadura sp. 7K534]
MREPAAVAADHDFEDLDISWLRRKEGVKWRRVGRDVLPAWIADMDFPVAEPIRAAISETVLRGDLGYPTWSNWMGASPLAEPFTRRMIELHHWRPRPEWVRNFGDVVQAIQVVLRLTTRPGDAIALHTPNYPPILKSITMMGRRVLPSPLERSGDGWAFDPERLEREVAAAGCRTLIVVNPHNPTGRVYTTAELEALAGIALRNDMLVIADEIFADLAYPPHRHVPLASLSPDIAARTVTLTSATKAFNIAGLRCAVAHVGPAGLRETLDGLPPDYFGIVDVLGVEATRAAWDAGGPWLAALMDHLAANRDLIADALAARAPGIGYRPPQATHLAWLDCRSLGTATDPGVFFREKAKVELSSGESYGPGGTGFARLNFATSASILSEILNRMAEAVADER